MTRPPPLFIALLAASAAGLVAPAARSGGVPLEASPAPARIPGIGGGDGGATQSVFFVAKSENRNQVHYGIRLDGACTPVGRAPVFAYWRMFERGPQATEPLLSREVPAYGIASQSVEETATGSRVVIRLNALPGRLIAVDTARTTGGCTATARVVIAGVAASLQSVFVKLRWPFGVDYLLLTGRSAEGGAVVRERLQP